MKILVSPSSYKGFFSPSQVALAIKRGIETLDRLTPGADCQIALAPIADGGDGTIEAIHLSCGGEVNKLTVHGPLGEPVEAEWLELERSRERTNDDNFFYIEGGELPTRMHHKLALVELASACGITHLQGKKLKALDSHTIGAGEVLKQCFESDFDNIVLTVGGSASTDGGMGILSFLGARFLDSKGKQLEPCGRSLPEIAQVELSALKIWKRKLRLRVATDVVNPLLGPQGAASVFAPQKGASKEDVEYLERGLEHYANVMEEKTGVLGRNLTGAGAAGGVPFGLAVALNASIIPGFQWLSEMIGLENKVQQADIVICGEGKLDNQSVQGKATGELAGMCRRWKKRLLALPALSDGNVDWQALGIEFVQNTAKPGGTASLDDISTNATILLRRSMTCA